MFLLKNNDLLIITNNFQLIFFSNNNDFLLENDWTLDFMSILGQDFKIIFLKGEIKLMIY